MIGQTLGHYRIESKLGEGGMGVVYKAIDTRLGRPVAIKVLRPDAMAGAGRRRRFEQEARAASALNHPNIVTIHEIDTATTDRGPVDFIAMEFVPGKALDQLPGRKGLDVGTVLKYAVQIADALATAHAAGIVHRDLKPGNIMATESGLIKVLDFGLAKLTETEGEENAATETMAAPRTEEGMIVGTVAYMSPEQAQGKKVDTRSDIFSFGCVLHEMITGRRAFQGENRLSTLAAILNQEPKAASEIVENVPRDLEKILARCLRKDPDRRFQTAADLKVALLELKEESDSGKLAAQPGPGVRRPQVSVLTLAAAVAVVILAAGLGWWLRRPEKPQQGPVLIRLTADAGLTTSPAVSTNGTLLAYASDRGEEGNLDIWVKQIPNGEPLRITRDQADDTQPDFSPDGTQIAFHSDRGGGGIYVAPALGGAERLIGKPGWGPRFSPDGKWIAYWVGAGPVPPKIYIVPAAGGTSRLWRQDFAASRNPVWSPDSKYLLFFGSRDPEGNDWWVAPLEQGQAVRTSLRQIAREQGLGQGLGPVTVNRWIADGNRILFSAQLKDSTNIWQASISPGTWQAVGPLNRLTFGNAVEVQPSAGPGGSVVYASTSESIDIWSLPMDTNQGKVNGEPAPITRDATPDEWPTLSADGKKLAFLSYRSGNADVWIKDLESRKEAALTATPENESSPQISPDGSKVAFSLTENQKTAVYLVAAGGGASEKVCDACGHLWHFSPAGKLLFDAGVARVSDAEAIRVGSRLSDQRSLGLLDLATREKSKFLVIPDHPVTQARFSPDGRWIALVEVLGPGKARELIIPFRGPKAPDRSEWIAVTDGSTYDLVNWWSPDGNLLYFRSDRDGFDCFWAQRLDPATKHPRGAPFPAYHFHRARLKLANVSGATTIAVARDKLMFPGREETGNIWMAKLEGQR